jgi:hypothetical protein
MPVVTVAIYTADLQNRFANHINPGGNLQPLGQAVRNRLNAQFPAVQVQNVAAEYSGGQGNAIKFTITSVGDLHGEQVKTALR